MNSWHLPRALATKCYGFHIDADKDIGELLWWNPNLGRQLSTDHLSEQLQNVF